MTVYKIQTQVASLKSMVVDAESDSEAIILAHKLFPDHAVLITKWHFRGKSKFVACIPLGAATTTKGQPLS